MFKVDENAKEKHMSGACAFVHVCGFGGGGVPSVCRGGGAATVGVFLQGGDTLYNHAILGLAPPTLKT